jgi:hypothetical protein
MWEQLRCLEKKTEQRGPVICLLTKVGLALVLPCSYCSCCFWCAGNVSALKPAGLTPFDIDGDKFPAILENILQRTMLLLDLKALALSTDDIHDPLCSETD